MKVLVVAMAVALAVVVSASPAAAATPPTGSYATYASTAPGQFTATFSANAAFPAATIVTDNLSATATQGKSAFLGASTGFGALFGSSRLQPYLSIGTVSLGVASTTTITFASATPVGWGFALGDMDADYMSITASGPGGVLTASQLGVQQANTSALNYCLGASPKPSTCSALGAPYADYPEWCPDPSASATCAGYLPNTVRGRGTDSDGAYAWFVPNVPVTSVTLVFTPQLFLPSYQLWIAASAPAAAVSGVVGDGVAIPSGTALALLDSVGTPIKNIEDEDVLIPVNADGTFSFTTERGAYELELVLPPGSELETSAFPFAFTATGDVLDLGTLALTDPNALASTGIETAPLLSLAAALLVIGATARLVPTRGRRPRLY